ncbi:expansin-A7-like [Chenopodium quinoa]|uniref:Expansin n=1 Tax=Chenopodium quinoa TaxID=63459 RepID=A0A803LTR0_CHEQI|nr:expansin-A7-like [Chenopodium quinoa]
MGREMIIMRSSSFNCLLVVVLTMTIAMSLTFVDGYYGYNDYNALPSAPPGAPVYKPSTDWNYAHATFYGDESVSETMGGACGYGNLYDNGYGIATAAVSSVMFNNGEICGACYEIKCIESKWCYKDGPIIKITATNLCPPNWYQSADDGGWCNPPRSHFDLSKLMFMKIAEWTAGIVPVQYRRVPCVRQGGIRYQFQGNPYWLLVYVMNVGGSGDVEKMWVKGSKSTDWICMTRNWGASFQVFSELGGQSLSFKVKNGAGHTLVDYDVAPAYWSTSQTYEGKINFY